jgi:hypothetical protein
VKRGRPFCVFILFVPVGELCSLEPLMTQKRKERRLQAGKIKSLEFSDSKSFFLSFSLSFFDSSLFYAATTTTHQLWLLPFNHKVE